MKWENLKNRTKRFAIAIIQMARGLPPEYALRTIIYQIIKSASSVGAYYRAACRSKSPKDFLNKLKIVEEELDETQYWLEILEELEITKKEQLSLLRQESNELISIVVQSIKTVRNKLISTS
jgi:four helix bundle protein